MDVLRPVRAFDRTQQLHPWLAIPLAVVKKFTDDGAGGLAALIAYYSFFSLFPLLLVFVTILGYVFHGDKSVEKTIEDSVVAHFPVIGSSIRSHQLSGSVAAVVVGGVIALWAGLGVTQAAQNAFDRVWAVPYKARRDFLRKRLRGLLLLAVLGTLFVISSVISGLVSAGLGSLGYKTGGIAISVLLNVVLFTAVFRLLTTAAVPTRSIWMGALIGGVLWEILQVLGGVYVTHVVNHATEAYGVFATVLGLLAWLHLGALATLYAAEVNVVVMRDLWPRSLLGAPSEPADESALRALAKVEERSEYERIEVEFRTGGPSGGQEDS
ncbi:MAG: YihY/virulence factor BrkB family protein [Solirubrobacterales bacterium]|nr:YihY/virulence factor BrkB family protein [Solirubrobacterales bacterium]